MFFKSDRREEMSCFLANFRFLACFLADGGSIAYLQRCPCL